AIERVVVGIAGQLVVGSIAGAAARAVQQDEVFDIGRQRVAGKRGADRVVAFAGILGHHVAGIVDDIGVVASAASHAVGAAATVDHIVPGIAGQRIGVVAVDQVLDADEHVVAGAQRVLR